MSWQNAWKLAKSDYIKLVPILALAFYMAFIPHLNYPYAVHIDEWVHIAHQNALLRVGDIYYPDPFSGQGSGGGVIAQLELGYHLPLAVFYQLSGVSWMDIARYFPSITFVFTVLSVYIFAKKIGFGWEAAFFTCLIPTTVGIMGPALMVPVAMALAFVPLLLYLFFNHKTPWSYMVIIIFIAFMVILHATSAILMIIILVPSLFFGLRGDTKHSLLVMLVLALPFIFTLPWTSSLILSEARNLFVLKELPAYHDFLRIIKGYGYLPIIFCLTGVFILSLEGTWKKYALVMSLLALLAMLTLFYTLHYGIGLLYFRGLLFAMLMMSIVAGAGLMALRKLELPGIIEGKPDRPLIIKAAGTLLCLIAIGAILAVAIPNRQKEPFYHMIDKVDYEAFVWIRDNTDPSQQKAILDPWKATAFTAITEKYVYTRIHMAPTTKSTQTYDFLKNGSAD
ncbi:hypothetical protein ACFLUQ_01205, partial [Chloroflexota bacterium]